MSDLPDLELAPEFQGDDQHLDLCKKFKPYDDWVKKFKTSEDVAVKHVWLQNVDMIGTRLSSVRLDVQLESTTGNRTNQAVMLCLDNFVNVLCVFAIDNDEYAMLVTEPRAAITSASHKEVVFGCAPQAASPEGGLERCRVSELLKELGVNISFKDPKTVHELNNPTGKSGPQQLYPGAVGAAPQRWYLYKRKERAEFKAKFPVATADGCTADLLPLESLYENTTSTRTLVGLALYEQAKAGGLCPQNTV